jgi:hypothetical protein
MLTLDKNDLKGDDQPVCGANEPSTLKVFTGDCSEIECGCCSTCCTDDDTKCNDLELKANLDDGYSREQYIFSEDLKFTVSASGGSTQVNPSN